MTPSQDQADETSPAAAERDLRLRADALLAETGLLDAEEDPALHAVAALAASICATPMGAVTLLDGSRQFFAGALGVTVREMPRSLSFCTVAVQTPDEPMLVPDARTDPRFADNPLVQHAPGIRSYAGMPLTAPEGVALGAVCAFDTVPMALTAAQIKDLRALGTITSALLEAHRTTNRCRQPRATPTWPGRHCMRRAGPSRRCSTTPPSA